MVSVKLKETIFKRLYSELSHVEIIDHEGFIWFIDREKKHWYFRYCKTNNRLLWRVSFVNEFFGIFSMDSTESVPVISSWVEEVLNHKVNTTGIINVIGLKRVEEVLNCKVVTTDKSFQDQSRWVEEVLNCKVVTTQRMEFKWNGLVGEVLNSVVDTSPGYEHMPQVKNVLNYPVNHTHSIRNEVAVNASVKKVLNYTVNGTQGQRLRHEKRVEDILEREVKKDIGMDSNLEIMVSKILNPEKYDK